MQPSPRGQLTADSAGGTGSSAGKHDQNTLICALLNAKLQSLAADQIGGYGSCPDAGGHHGARPGAGGPRRRQHLACPASDPQAPLICAEPGHGTHKLSAAGARDLGATTRSRGGRPAVHRMRPPRYPIRNRSGPRTTLGQHRYPRGMKARLLPDSGTGNAHQPRPAHAIPGHRHDQRPKRSAGGHRAQRWGASGGTSGLHCHRIHERKTLMSWLEPPYGIEP